MVVVLITQTQEGVSRGPVDHDAVSAEGSLEVRVKLQGLTPVVACAVCFTVVGVIR